MEDLFNMNEETGMDFLEKKSVADDGIYRVKPENAKDKKKGYRAVIRFLPNLTKEGKLGVNAVEKMIHYVKLQDYPELNGYYDSMRNFNEKCDLTNTYWQLKNSNSAADQEKAELISRSTKYYSYIQIVEDENQPELEGKIMIFPFGYKIKDKILQEKNGEITGEKCNVYDLANGKEFVLLVKEIGGYINYDSSQFKQETSAIKLLSKDGKLKEIPTEEEDGRKVITNAKIKEAIKKFLTDRKVDLEDFSPQRWSDDERNKVDRIVGILTNNPVAVASKSIDSSSKGDILTESETLQEDSDDIDEIFNESESDSVDDFFDV